MFHVEHRTPRAPEGVACSPMWKARPQLP